MSINVRNIIFHIEKISLIFEYLPSYRASGPGSRVKRTRFISAERNVLLSCCDAVTHTVACSWKHTTFLHISKSPACGALFPAVCVGDVSEEEAGDANF